MSPREQLEKAVEWSKRATTWMYAKQPVISKLVDPLLTRTAGNLGYSTFIYEFIQATDAPMIIQTALYIAAAKGLQHWDEIVIQEINRGLNEYNAKQNEASPFGLTKTAVIGAATLVAISTFSSNFDSNSQGSPIIRDRVKAVQQEVITPQLSKIVEDQFLEAQPERIILDDGFVTEELPYHQLELEHILVAPENLNNLRTKLFDTFSRIELLEQDMHPRVKARYDIIKGNNWGEVISRIERYDRHIKRAAEKNDIPYTLLYGVIMNESSGFKRARSSASARGLMQIKPRTAKWFAREYMDMDITADDLDDPRVNIKIGARYLKWLHDKYAKRILMANRTGDQEINEDELWNIALACYNEGHGTIIKAVKDNMDVKSYWDFNDEHLRPGVLKYVPNVIAKKRIFTEYLQQQASMSNGVARLVH